MPLLARENPQNALEWLTLNTGSRAAGDNNVLTDSRDAPIKRSAK